MASSLISNSLHVSFDSVLAMDDVGIVAMCGDLVESGLKGFLGCPAIFYEDALTEFFQNGSVRDGMVVSTIQGTSVEISEEIFAGAFALPLDGLTDLSEIPKDLIFDARIIFSDSGEQVSTSCKKQEIKIEFRLLSDFLAKSIFVKAGFLFNIFKEMVTAGSRQPKGYAIQICLLLKDVPALELGDSKAFPSPRLLTEKTVHRYVVINEKVTVEVVANKPRVKRTPVKKAVSRKRPATAEVVEPVVSKKKRNKVRKADKGSVLITVAQEAVLLKNVEPTLAAPADQPWRIFLRNTDKTKEIEVMWQSLMIGASRARGTPVLMYDYEPMDQCNHDTEIEHVELLGSLDLNGAGDDPVDFLPTDGDARSGTVEEIQIAENIKLVHQLGARAVQGSSAVRSSARAELFMCRSSAAQVQCSSADKSTSAVIKYRSDHRVQQ
ncbi:hypothetical protein F511_28398 [Dorcoceras hygrometricum]|uniref:Dystroglycan-like n=1 Tax=Dorcoceras hygrometricum TaxID=472368 RepID=A0A2Z7B3G6_9LAMI|nr:hypothetical protein F511_28398 [Dorcoceras hygrometricum]